MWDLVRGAAQLKQPAPAELGRRYAEMLAENLGQPGFRELLIAVHDVDAHRDLVFALVGDERRRDLIRRPTTEAAEARRAEVFDLAGVAREHLPDAVAAALTIPLATEWHSVTFAADGYWRGETHRLCDRPAGLIRLIDELIDLGVEQICSSRRRRSRRARTRSPPAHRRARPARRIPPVVRSGDRARRDHDDRRACASSTSARRTTRSGRSTLPAATTSGRSGGRGSAS